MEGIENLPPKEMRALRKKLNNEMNKKFGDVKFARKTVNTYKSIVKERFGHELKERKQKYKDQSTILSQQMEEYRVRHFRAAKESDQIVNTLTLSMMEEIADEMREYILFTQGRGESPHKTSMGSYDYSPIISERYLESPI